MARDLKRVPTVSHAPKTGSRKTRHPRHNWRVVHKPFQLQPVCFAPVAAGDSVKNIRFEQRVLTDPVKDQITGWWSEMYWFYVRFSNLDEAEKAKAMAVTPGYDTTQFSSAARASHDWTFFTAGSNLVDWLYLCMQPIVRTYFRSEGGDWNDHTIDGVPAAGVVGRTWLDALHDYSDLTPPASPDTYEGRWELYEQLRKQKLVTMDFPEFLRMQGTVVPEQLIQPEAEKRKPELLRFCRQFSYPTNTVNPDGTGVVSALSWVVAERMDRAIYCDEPGFIVGLSVVRPKIYRSGQISHGASFIRDARTLLPDLFGDDAPSEVLDRWASGGGPLSTSDGYVLDLSSVYTLGDQFLRGSGLPAVALPGSADSNVSYVSWQQAASLFANPGDDWGETNPGEPDVAPADNIHVDGQAAFSITGRKVTSTITE